MAKKVNKPLLWKTDEAGIGRFLFIFFIFHNTYEATFFQSEKRQRWKAFQTDEGGPGKQLTFFPIWLNLKKSTQWYS